MDYDVYLVTSATILYPWEGLVDSQASEPSSFVVSVLRQVKLPHVLVACMLCMLGHETHVCNISLLGA